MSRRILVAALLLPLAALGDPPPAAPTLRPIEGPAVDIKIDTGQASQSLDDVVVLAAKRPQPLREAAASTSVITAADLEAFGWTSFTDALASLAGFYTTNPGDSTYIGVRGVSLPSDNNGRILILVDGHQQQELWSHSAYPELIGLDPTMIDHIEVLRGPASSLYGSLGFLAIINVVTRRGVGSEWVRATYQMRNLSDFRGVLTLGHHFANGLQFSIQAQGRLGLGDSYFYPDLVENDPKVGADVGCVPNYIDSCTRGQSRRGVDASRGFSVFGNASWKGLSLKASYQWLDKQIPFAPWSTIFNHPTNHYLMTRAYVDLGYEVGRPEVVLFQARAYYDRASWVDDLAYAPEPANADGTASAHPLGYVFRDEAVPWWIGGDVKFLLTREKANWLRATLTGGGEITWLNVSNRSWETGVPTLNPAPTMAGATVAIPATNLTSPSPILGAIYGQAELTFARKISLTLGARGDFSDRYPSEFSPRVGLVMFPYASGTFKLLYAHGFINPSWYASFFSDNTSVVSNHALRPERADNYELVFQQQLGRPLTLTASVFYIHGDDLIYAVDVCVDPLTGAPQGTCAEGMPQRLQYTNISSFQSIGAEIGIVGRFTNGARFYANYTYAHATQNGKPAVNSPEHLAKAGLAYPLWRKHLVAGIEGRFWSSRRLNLEQAVDGYKGPEETDPFFLLSAHVTWKDLPRGLNVTLHAQNLTMQTYYDPAVAESSKPILRMPHSGLNVFVRLSYAY